MNTLSDDSANDSIEAWAPERDWALSEFERAFTIEKQTLLAMHGPNMSIPYQRGSDSAVTLFADIGESLRSRVRELMPSRTLTTPEALAEYVIQPMARVAQAELQRLVEQWRARGGQNMALVDRPVGNATERIRRIADSIGAGIAEDARADAKSRATRPAASSLAGVPRRRVLTLHGIETSGTWQKEITAPLGEADFIAVPLDYGKYSWVWLLWRPSRRRQVEWFFREYLSKRREDEPLPHLIAHSFGTYLAAEAMRKYPEIRFEAIVFCGAIVEREYPWNELQRRGQFNRLLNEVGGRDWYVRVAEWALVDAGSSGTGEGFNSISDGVQQNPNLHFHHSDALYPARLQRLWIPFLRGEPVVTDIPVPSAKANTRFRLLILVATLTLVLAVAITRCSKSDPPLRPLAESLAIVTVPPPASASTLRSTPSVQALADRRPPPPSSGDGHRAPTISPVVVSDAPETAVRPSPTKMQRPANDPSKAVPKARENTAAKTAPPTVASQETSSEPARTQVSESTSTSAKAPSATPSNSEEDALFLKAMKGYRATTVTIRESLIWFVTARKTPIPCAVYVEFVKPFSAYHRDRSFFEMDDDLASRDDVITETAYYADISGPGCITMLMPLATIPSTTHVLLAAQAIAADTPMEERRRRHARTLARRMSDVLALLDGKSLIDMDSSLHARANYLAYMASAIVNRHPELVPKGVEAVDGNPFWRKRLRIYVEGWQTIINTVADSACSTCATSVEGSGQ